jgi:hypothetical protein
LEDIIEDGRIPLRERPLMLKILSALEEQFETTLRRKAVPQNAVSSPDKIPLTPFTKGTRGREYHFSETQRESLAYFLGKLQKKRQSRE